MLTQEQEVEHLMLTTEMLPDEIANKIRMPLVRVIKIKINLYKRLLTWHKSLLDELENIDLFQVGQNQKMSIAESLIHYA